MIYIFIGSHAPIMRHVRNGVILRMYVSEQRSVNVYEIMLAARVVCRLSDERHRCANTTSTQC